MTIDLRLIGFFVELAHDLSFTRTAAKLGITQPYLSMRIRQLEEQLGIRLFDRTSRTVVLTTQGAELLVEARSLIEQTDRLEKLAFRIRHGMRQEVRIGAIDYARPFKRRLLSKLSSDHPHLTVQIEPINMSTSAYEQLADGRLDAALLLLREGHAPSPEFEAMQLARMPIGLLLPSTSPMANGPAIRADLLKNSRVAIFRRETSPQLHNDLLQILEAVGAIPALLPEPTEGGVIDFVLDTQMPTICAQWWLSDQDCPDRLTHLPIEGHQFMLTCNLVRLRNRRQGAIKNLWNTARALQAELVSRAAHNP